MKEITYQVKRVLETLPIIDDYVAVKETNYIDNKECKVLEYISTNTLINNAIGDMSLIKDNYLEMFKKVFVYTSDKYTFFDEKVLKDFLIVQPYSYVLEHGEQSVVLLHIDGGNNQYINLENKKVPLARYFDYTHGINNGFYDLNLALAKLQARNDIEIVPDKMGNLIQDIPYYNAEKYKDKFIEFIWHPSYEDYNSVDFDCFKQHELIEKVFGIKENKITMYDLQARDEEEDD